MTDLHIAPWLRQKSRALAVAATLLFAVSTFAAPPAVAAGSPPASNAAASGRATFGIKPSHATTKTPLDTRPRFEYTATPGAQQPDFVAVTNYALTPLTLSVYPSDGFNTASDGFDLLVASKRPVDLGSWVTMRSSTLTIKPGATVVVPFTIKVPLKATPGDHVGGIVASLRTFGVDKKGDKVAIDQRVGARIYMRIQGSLDPRLTVSHLRASYRGSIWNPFGSGKVTLTYTVDNPGNVRLGAHQSADVSGQYGGTHSAALSDIAELLPGNSHNEQIVVSGVGRAFHEKAQVQVDPFSLPGDTDGRVEAVTATVSFWAVPWALLLCIALLGLLLSAVLVVRRRRRARLSAPAKAGQVRRPAVVKP